MIETLFTTAKTVVLVAVVIPMMMGLALSLVGFGALEWSRFIERREIKQSGGAKSGSAVEPVDRAPVPMLATADS